MTYEEWLKNREESKQSNDADYNKWLVQSGKVDIDSIGNEINERVNTWLKNNENYILNANDRFTNPIWYNNVTRLRERSTKTK